MVDLEREKIGRKEHYVGNSVKYPEQERVEGTRDGRKDAKLFAGHMKALLTDRTCNTPKGMTSRKAWACA